MLASLSSLWPFASGQKPTLQSTQPFQNRVHYGVGESEKHSGITVAFYQGNLRHTQAHLKEVGDF
jgi:hypothetical protein